MVWMATKDCLERGSLRLDVVLFDIQIANMDGWRIMMERREGEHAMDILFIISSVLDRDGGDLHYIADDFLKKPVSCNQLASIIRRYCHKRPTGERRTVPVMEDDVEIGSVIRQLPKSQGCEVPVHTRIQPMHSQCSPTAVWIQS